MDQVRITLEQLERRREDSSRAMWLAPGLTMAAQAFLLQTLADGSLSQRARLAVLLAGIASTLAALWSLLRAHAREVQYSEEIDWYTKGHGLGEIKPTELIPLEKLDKAEAWPDRADRRIVMIASGREGLRAYLLWAVALILFIVADIAVYCAV